MDQLFSRARIRATGTAGETGGGSLDEPSQAAGRGAGVVEVEDGAAVDAIAACIGARDFSREHTRDGEGSGSDDGCVAARLEDLVELQREVDGSAAEWARKRKPGAGERTALLVIESVRTQALLRIAALSESEEPVSAEEVARLALALYRITDADRLRVAREQAIAAAPDQPAEPEPLSKAEFTTKIHKAITDQFFPGRWGTPAWQALWDTPSPAETDAAPPDGPAGSGVDSFARETGDVGDERDAGEAHDAGDAHDSEDSGEVHDEEGAHDPDEAHEADHVRGASDTDHARRARDARDPPDVHIARHRDRWAWGGEFWPPEIPLDPGQW